MQEEIENFFIKKGGKSTKKHRKKIRNVWREWKSVDRKNERKNAKKRKEGMKREDKKKENKYIRILSWNVAGLMNKDDMISGSMWRNST